MSRSAAPLLWQLAHRPAPSVKAGLKMADGDVTCALCGLPVPRSFDANRVLGLNFTNRTCFRAPSSDRVCEACTWAASGKPPWTLRMWSIVATPGTDLGASQPKAFLQDTPGLLLTSRHDTTRIIHTLREPPAGDWVVSVATSGQKQVVPYTQINRGDRWTVRMESTNVTATSTQFRCVFSAALTLRRLGIPAGKVLTGEPAFLKTRQDYDTWLQTDHALADWHTSPLLALALWTITKGITNDHTIR